MPILDMSLFEEKKSMPLGKATGLDGIAVKIHKHLIPANV